MQLILIQGNRGPDGRSGIAGPIGKKVTGLYYIKCQGNNYRPLH